MICAMTARRIADGQTEQFLNAFSSGVEGIPPDARERFKTVLACRQIDDPSVILTFGLFDGTADELRALQSSAGRGDQLDAIAPLVEETLIDGSFEVLRDFAAEATGTAPFSRFAGTR